VDNAYADKDAVFSVLNDFLVNLTIAIGLDPITLQEFVSQKAGGKLVAIAANLKTERDDFKREKDYANLIIANFHESFSIEKTADPTIVLRQISSLREKVAKQSAAIRERSRKWTDLTRAFQTLHRKLESDTTDFQSQISALNGTIVALRTTVEELTAANLNLRKELQNTQHEYQNLQQSSTDAQVRLRETHDSEFLSAKQAHAVIETQLRKELTQHQQKLSELSDNFAAQTEQLQTFRQTLGAQKVLLAEKNEELSNTRAEAEEQQQQLLRRWESEKEHLIETHETVLTDLHERSDEQRADIAKLTAAFVESEQRGKEGKVLILELKRTNLKLERDLDALQKQTERDRKLAEANAKAAQLRTQSDYANRLDEQRAAWESERHRLLAFVADAFKRYLSLHDSIDERAVRQAVGKAKRVLDTLTESDEAIRRIVGAAVAQRTDDAVAQAFMGKL
jgi:DNA repair exonuclease SbcCD ATPase subunit